VTLGEGRSGRFAPGGVPRLLLWHWGRRGGGPKYTIELARALAGREDIATSLSLSPQAEIYPDAMALGLPIFPVTTYRDRVSAVAALARLPSIRRRFRQHLMRNRIDVVVATMSHIWHPVMVDAVKQAGARLITVVHDAVAHPGDDYPLRRWMMRRELRYSDQIVALSRHVAGQLVREYDYPPSLITVIPHGVFPFGPVRRREPPIGRPFRFLFFGRLLPYKGLDLLLDAMALLDPSVAVELAIVGSGDLGSLEDRIAADPRIRLDRRWVPEGEVRLIFDAADAIVSPYREASQSGVLAGAYGAGMPMIATPIGGLTEQVATYGAGLVADDMTAAAFARAMRRLATEPDLYRRCVENTLRTAAGPLSWPAIAGQFAGLLRDH